ncbi:MAG: type III-B CRISPR module RAMP protein Cmr4, partial [Candidatus Latescibacteria bacterium]|nr:type III-B CRISPR module RAMP protein Cmr4 [Candidatus Latescibacterota bacterium]
MEKAILSLFARTPLHIGAGSSVGAIDQPVVRERHTRFPVIPGSSLKGVLSDLWDSGGIGNRTEEGTWLFGAEDSNNASAGALLIGEGKLLAFPIRSAKGSFAWITCPLALSRFKRDAGSSFKIPVVDEEKCIASSGVLMEEDSVILEEYVFSAEHEVDEIVT